MVNLLPHDVGAVKDAMVVRVARSASCSIYDGG